MSTILDNLARFNRHERFYLVGWALGNPHIALDSEVRQCLDEKLHLRIPEKPCVAMDYTLDWLYASLVLPFDDIVFPPYPLDVHLFVVASPRPPRQLRTDCLPSWMLDNNGELAWIE